MQHPAAAAQYRVARPAAPDAAPPASYSAHSDAGSDAGCFPAGVCSGCHRRVRPTAAGRLWLDPAQAHPPLAPGAAHLYFPAVQKAQEYSCWAFQAALVPDIHDWHSVCSVTIINMLCDAVFSVQQGSPAPNVDVSPLPPQPPGGIMAALQPDAFASAPSLTIDWWSVDGSHSVGLDDDPAFGCGVFSHVQRGSCTYVCIHHAGTCSLRAQHTTYNHTSRALLLRLDQFRRWHVPDAGLRHPLKLPAPGPSAANQR